MTGKGMWNTEAHRICRKSPQTGVKTCFKALVNDGLGGLRKKHSTCEGDDAISVG